MRNKSLFDVPSSCNFALLLLHPHPPQELESRKEEIFDLENEIKELQRRSAGKNASQTEGEFCQYSQLSLWRMCFGIALGMLRASTQPVLQNVIKVKVMKEGMLRSPASKLSKPLERHGMQVEC